MADDRRAFRTDILTRAGASSPAVVDELLTYNAKPFPPELAVQPPANDKTFSLVNMTFDNKGRLLVSRENGPVLLCTDPDDKGV